MAPNLKSQRAGQPITPALIDVICQRLSHNQRVRRTLPRKGRLHIDRQLPVLCVYRQPPDFDDAGTRRLVNGEAAYLIASGEPACHQSLSRLVQGIVKTLSPEFGAFLIIEIWSAADGGKANDPSVPSVLPRFTIHAPATGLTRVIDAMEKQLSKIKVQKQGVEVEVARNGKTHPPDMKPLLGPARAKELDCSTLGLALPPVYRKANSTHEFPLLARSLRRYLSLALRQTYFEFVRVKTTHRPRHFHALGRKAVVKAVWEIDRHLASVSNQFDYLLQLTPVNTTSAWKQFRREQFERSPEFHYRPLPVDPAVLKRQLYNIRIDRVEDPALQHLFEEKQEELELKITMLRDRDTPKFLYESLQLFGGVNHDLLQLAEHLLDRLSGNARREKGRRLNAEAFALRAEEEFAAYRKSCPGFVAKTRVSSDVSGVIVSRGRLLINSDLKLAPSRVAALLAHEVGTHLVTYNNGRLQPFQQLYSGLAGYEELQEGLAVLSEYLVGGLGHARMRQLAARVVTVHNLTKGASFVESFRSLERDYGFRPRSAFSITMRVYRGGGFTKDAVYLRGLREILKYVRKGGDLGPLFVGKMAVEHIPIIKELQYRGVLDEAPIIPHYLEQPQAIERLQQLRDGTSSVLDLVTSLCETNGLSR